MKKTTYWTIIVLEFLTLGCLLQVTHAYSEAPSLHLPFMEGEVWRCDCGWGDSQYHSGCGYHSWDLNWGGGYDDLGKPVASPAAGVVVGAGWLGGGWGNTVRIDYDEGVNAYGRLAHLDTILVSEGEHVESGQIIGLCGGSGGYSPHIHYQTEDSDHCTIPSEFAECGVPVTGGYYLSQNSQIFCNAFNANGGAVKLGQPVSDIYWYFDYTPQMTDPSCYIQEYDGGEYGWCALVYDGLGGAHRAYLIRTGFWGAWRTLGEGGPRSPLGYVLNSEYSYQGTARQDFTFGYMVWNNGHADITYYSDIGSVSPGYGSMGGTQAFIDHYNDNGAGANFGNPSAAFTGNAGVQTWGSFQIQYFWGGDFGECAITYDPTPRYGGPKTAHVLRGGHFVEYLTHWYPGTPGDFIGPPSSDPFSAGCGDRGLRQNFQKGYYMVEEAGAGRVYASNGAELDPDNLAFPETVSVVDEGDQSCDPTFHFSWPVPGGSRDFYLQVATDPGFNSIDWEGWLNSSSGDIAWVGTHGNSYYARVRCQGANGVVGDWGGSSNGIRVGCTVPTYDEGVFSNDPVVHFSYPVPAGTEMVHMQICTNSGFESPVWEGDLPPTGDYAFSGQDGQTYYARVKMQEGGHWGEYGAPSDGITIGMTFPCLDDGDLSVDPTFHVFVTYVPGMIKAYFQIATSPLFPPGSIVWEGEVSGLDKAYAGGGGVTYWARAKVFDDSGHWGGFGEISNGITIERTAASWDEGVSSADSYFRIYYEMIEGTDEVYMQVSTDPDFGTIFWEGITPYTGDRTLEGNMGETYYGRIKVREGGHWGSYGSCSDGITLGLAPLAWDDGDYSADNLTTFQWEHLPGFEFVHYQIATDPNFNNVVDEGTTTETSYQFAGDPDTKYYFRVRGQEGTQPGPFSNTTDGVLLASDSWVSDEGAVSPDRVVVFDFDSYIGAQNAFCQIARDPDFTEIVWEGFTNNVTGKFRFTGTPGDYLYARVGLADNKKMVREPSVSSDGILIRRQMPQLMPALSAYEPPTENHEIP